MGRAIDITDAGARVAPKEGRRKEEERKKKNNALPASTFPVALAQRRRGKGRERGAAARVPTSVRSKPTHTSTNYRTRAPLNPPRPLPMKRKTAALPLPAGVSARLPSRDGFSWSQPPRHAQAPPRRKRSRWREGTANGSFGAPALLKLRAARIDAAAAAAGAAATDASAASCTASYPRTSPIQIFQSNF